MKITVAICTWNRADLLDKTLQQMEKLNVPTEVEWELLVVNNNCTDHTSEVIRSFEGRLPIREILETKQGLSHARNRAIAEAQGEIIQWTDDDVLTNDNWLAVAFDAFRNRPGLTGMGGVVAPLFECEPPKWLSENLDTFGCFYALRNPPGGAVSRVTTDYVPYGANMAFRTKVLREHLFDHSRGRVGSDLTSGEDAQLIRDLLSRGHEIIWEPNSKVSHFISEDRMTIAYLRKLHFDQGRALARNRQVQDPSLFGRPRWLVRKYAEANLAYWWKRATSYKPEFWLPQYLKLQLLRGEMSSSH